MKRFKKIAAIGGLIVGTLVALLLIVNAVLVWITGARLEERLQAIRAAGDPVTLKDIARPPMPPEKNAAVYLRRARDDLQALEKELSHVNHTPANPNSEEGPLTEADKKAIRSAFAAYPQVLPLLEQAAACPDYDADLDYTAAPQTLMEAILPLASYNREIARVLDVRVRWLTADGERVGALHDCLLLLRLTRHFDHQPFLIASLVTDAVRSVAVGMTNRVLRAGPLADKDRDALEAELARAEGLEGYRHGLVTERALFLSSFGSTIPVSWFNRALANDDECQFMDLMNEQLTLSSEPYAAVTALEGKINQDPGAWRWRFSRLSAPAVLKVRAALDRVRAQVRCLRVLNALQRLHKEPGGAIPRLTDLGLPAEAVTDPFNGQPLHLGAAGKEWVVYSVGTDLKDDGGDLAQNKDFGVGPVAGNGK